MHIMREMKTTGNPLSHKLNVYVYTGCIAQQAHSHFIIKACVYFNLAHFNNTNDRGFLKIYL